MSAKLTCPVCTAPFEDAEFVARMIFVNGVRHVTGRDWRLPCGHEVDDSRTEFEYDHYETMVRSRETHEIYFSWVEGKLG